MAEDIQLNYNNQIKELYLILHNFQESFEYHEIIDINKT